MSLASQVWGSTFRLLDPNIFCVFVGIAVCVRLKPWKAKARSSKQAGYWDEPEWGTLHLTERPCFNKWGEEWLRIVSNINLGPLSMPTIAKHVQAHTVKKLVSAYSHGRTHVITRWRMDGWRDAKRERPGRLNRHGCLSVNICLCPCCILRSRARVGLRSQLPHRFYLFSNEEATSSSVKQQYNVTGEESLVWNERGDSPITWTSDSLSWWKHRRIERYSCRHA